MALRAMGVVLRQGMGMSGMSAPKFTPMLASVQPRRCYAMRQELTEQNIVWRRPEHVPSWKPEKSGDLEPYEEPKLERTKIKFLPVKDALEKADDVTKLLLTLKYGTIFERVRATRYDVMRDVQRHQYDTGSMETTIAMLTVRIRKSQQELLTTTRGLKHTVRQRVTLQETIAYRKKLLKHLRRMDYKKFEWVIAKLGILYRPPPRYVRFVTRKISLRKLVRHYGQDLRRERLEVYRLALEGRKADFQAEKAEALKWIAETETSLGMPVSVEVEEGEVKAVESRS
ncbi:28S ribosomal protein S15, mitochondrial [Chionoecetes opilio]|uniref:Small ribosomal subunit protein uS15m n=1 Tax=Chionoecetes opilio TaxID=41210 RepID=A0A8J5BXI3_CHIOP|nr:28S ribosomal protein S15, mitochondrial [Chionoecetes opilio]